jgi:hypothetical protein
MSLASLPSVIGKFLQKSPWLFLGLMLCIPCIVLAPDRIELLLWYIGKATIAYAVAVLIDSGAAKAADPRVSDIQDGESPEITQRRERNRQLALLRRAVTIAALQIAFGLAP